MWLQFNFPTVFPSMSSLFTYRTVLVSQIGVLPRKLLFALQDPVSASPPLRPDERRAVVLQRTVPQPPAWGRNRIQQSSLAWPHLGLWTVLSTHQPSFRCPLLQFPCESPEGVI